MDKNKVQNSTLMWFARITGLVISIFWMYGIIQTIIETGFKSLSTQTSTGIILFLIITTLSIGVLIAWRHPMPGGRFIIILSVLLSIFIYFSTQDNRLIPILYQGLPYFLVGLLFIQSQAVSEEES
ncbi:MAG: hypothetical protein MUP11_04545 [Anaerolineales bacterium]|nr:hypothetical protein [Anaerolineales bacterium]